MGKAMVILFVLLLSGCAVAPLTHGHPARALEASQWEGGFQWSATTNQRGTATLFPVGRLRFGVSDRWTLSAYSETRTLSVSAQNEYYRDWIEDGAAAIEGGIALGAGAVSVFFGHTLSARFENWEPFWGVQVFFAHLKPGSFDDSFFNGAPSLHPVFFTTFLGTRYWILEDFVLGAHATILVSTKGVHFRAPVLPSLSFAFLW